MDAYENVYGNARDLRGSIAAVVETFRQALSLVFEITGPYPDDADLCAMIPMQID